MGSENGNKILGIRISIFLGECSFGGILNSARWGLGRNAGDFKYYSKLIYKLKSLARRCVMRGSDVPEFLCSGCFC